MPKKLISGMLSSIPDAQLVTQFPGLDLTTDTDFTENQSNKSKTVGDNQPASLATIRRINPENRSTDVDPDSDRHV